MGLFRRKDERAIPEPGTPEFDAAVEDTALPDPQSVSMGEKGWSRADEKEATDRRGTLLRMLARQVPNSGGIGRGIPKKKKPDA